MKYEEQIKALYTAARDITTERGIGKTYRIELFREELAKPQYAKTSIPTKHIREMLRILIEEDLK